MAAVSLVCCSQVEDSLNESPPLYGGDPNKKGDRGASPGDGPGAGPARHRYPLLNVAAEPRWAYDRKRPGWFTPGSSVGSARSGPGLVWRVNWALRCSLRSCSGQVSE